MSKFSVGSKVWIRGNCECSPAPIKGADIWFDIKDCYHSSNTVRRVFRDGKSAWIANRYGFGRRVLNKDLTRVTDIGVQLRQYMREMPDWLIYVAHAEWTSLTSGSSIRMEDFVGWLERMLSPSRPGTAPTPQMFLDTIARFREATGDFDGRVLSTDLL